MWPQIFGKQTGNKFLKYPIEVTKQWFRMALADIVIRGRIFSTGLFKIIFHLSQTTVVCCDYRCLICACVLSRFNCVRLFDPWTVICQAPLSMGFSRQEYWSGLDTEQIPTLKKSSSATPSESSAPESRVPGNHWCVLYHCALVFCRTLYVRRLIVCRLLILTSFTESDSLEMHAMLHGSRVHCSLRWVAFHGVHVPPLVPICQLEDIWVISISWQLWIELL